MVIDGYMRGFYRFLIRVREANGDTWSMPVWSRSREAAIRHAVKRFGRAAVVDVAR